MIALPCSCHQLSPQLRITFCMRGWHCSPYLLQDLHSAGQIRPLCLQRLYGALVIFPLLLETLAVPLVCAPVPDAQLPIMGKQQVDTVMAPFRGGLMAPVLTQRFTCFALLCARQCPAVPAAVGPFRMDRRRLMGYVHPITLAATSSSCDHVMAPIGVSQTRREG